MGPGHQTRAPANIKSIHKESHIYLCKDSILINGSVLHATLSGPDNLLVLLKAAVQKIYLDRH